MLKKSLKEQLQSRQTGQEDIQMFDEILSDPVPQPIAAEKIVKLPIGKLVEYKDENFEKLTSRPQPFRAYNQDELEAMAESIKRNGVITPITVRPFGAGQYQILSGRNRVRASAICGLSTIPGIIKDGIDDVQAALIMLDTNLEQRPSSSYSEKAFAYKMRKELLTCRGKRNDLHGGTKKDTLSEVGRISHDSRRTVAYLIRLTYLIPELLKMVDDKRLAFTMGVSISYLSLETQKYLYQWMQESHSSVRKDQIDRLTKLEMEQRITQAQLESIFQRDAITHPRSFTINAKYLQGYEYLLEDRKELHRLFLEFLKSYQCSKGSRPG